MGATKKTTSKPASPQGKTTTPIPLAICSIEGKILYINTSALRALAVPGKEIAELPASFLSTGRKAIEQGKPLQIAVDTNMQAVFKTAIPTGEKEFLLIGFSGSETVQNPDLSEVVKPNISSSPFNRLHSRYLFLREILDKTPNIIFVKDQDGRFVFANKTLADLHCTTPQEMVGKKDSEYISDSQLLGLAQTSDRQALQSGQNTTGYYLPIFDPAINKTRWFFTSKSRVQSLEEAKNVVLGVGLDMTEKKEKEDLFRFQTEMAEWIGVTSTRLINLPIAEMKEAIFASLGELGGILKANRIKILRKEGMVLINEYKWLADPDDPLTSKVPFYLLEDFSRMYDRLRKEGLLYLPDIEKLDQSQYPEVKLFRSWGVKSAIYYPMTSMGNIFGYFGVLFTENPTTFEEAHLNQIRLCAQLYANALDRKAKMELLRFKLKLEELIVSISTSFINLPIEQSNTRFLSTLESVGELMQANLASVLLENTVGCNLELTWSKDLPERNQMLELLCSFTQEKWVREALDAKGSVILTPQTNFAEAGDVYRDQFWQMKVISCIISPVNISPERKGCFILVNTEHKIQWPEECISLFRIVSQIFVNAIRRKESEEAFRESQELYRTLAANIPRSSVLLFDKTLRYRLAEGGALENQGYSKTGIEGRDIEEILSPEVREELMPLYKSALKGKETILEKEFNGRHFSIQFLPVKNAKGQIFAGMVVSVDISDFKAIQKKLEKQTVDLLRSNQDLEQFAYFASHDLNEPLRMVGSYVTLLEKRLDDQLSPEMRSFMHYATDGVSRMQNLINDLLDYSRVDNKKREMEYFPLRDILKIMELNLRQKLSDSNAMLNIGDMPEIFGDKMQILSLFQNLVGNGIKFRGENDPIITITAKERSRDWQFEISDNGIGIDPAYHEKIFIMFQRLHSRKDYPGTGLGLAICKKIVERHNGKIFVSSDVGKGAKFTFTLSKPTKK